MEYICPVCGERFKRCDSYIKRLHNRKPTCSVKCYGEYRVNIKGRNETLKRLDILDGSGFIRRLAEDHPRAVKGRVKLCVLLVERNWEMFDSIYFESINGFMILREGFKVVYKDGNKVNNDIGNLEVVVDVAYS